VILLPEEDSPPDCHSEEREDGVAIPFERIDPDTLRNLISEFVTREWEELGDSDHTLDDKISQVIRQLQTRKAKVVFDLKSGTCNIVRVD